MLSSLQWASLRGPWHHLYSLQDSATDNPSVNIIPLRDGTVMAVSGEKGPEGRDV